VLLEIGRESVRGGAIDELLDEAACALIEEAAAAPIEPRQRRLL